mgnify:CR=1 FL=1
MCDIPACGTGKTLAAFEHEVESSRQEKLLNNDRQPTVRQLPSVDRQRVNKHLMANAEVPSVSAQYLDACSVAA